MTATDPDKPDQTQINAIGKPTETSSKDNNPPSSENTLQNDNLHFGGQATDRTGEEGSGKQNAGNEGQANEEQMETITQPVQRFSQEKERRFMPRPVGQSVSPHPGPDENKNLNRSINESRHDKLQKKPNPNGKERTLTESYQSNGNDDHHPVALSAAPRTNQPNGDQPTQNKHYQRTLTREDEVIGPGKLRSHGEMPRPQQPIGRGFLVSDIRNAQTQRSVFPRGRGEPYPSTGYYNPNQRYEGDRPTRGLPNDYSRSRRGTDSLVAIARSALSDSGEDYDHRVPRNEQRISFKPRYQEPQSRQSQSARLNNQASISQPSRGFKRSNEDTETSFNLQPANKRPQTNHSRFRKYEEEDNIEEVEDPEQIGWNRSDTAKRMPTSEETLAVVDSSLEIVGEEDEGMGDESFEEFDPTASVCFRLFLC